MFFLLFLFFSIPTQALETSYIKFQEPQGWSCNQENTAWLCRSLDKVEKKESFLVIKAKLAGRSDNLQTFFNSLSTPMPLINSSSKSALSKVYSVNQIKIRNHPWVRSQHLNSTVQNYFTDYLVTVVGDLAIGIELTYHQSRYHKYKVAMDNIVNSIQLVDNIVSRNKKQSNTNQPRKFPEQFDIPNSSQASANKLDINKLLKKTLPYVIIGLVILILSLVFRKKI